MGQFTWEENQEVILLGVRKAGQHMIDNARNQERLTEQEADKMIKIGETIIRKFENCQENHLKEQLNFLLDL